MISFQDVKDYLILTSGFKYLGDFIYPESELYVLCLLRSSLQKGLGLQDINLEMIKNPENYTLERKITGDGLIERSFQYEISLDPILKTGKSFIYKGIIEPIGWDDVYIAYGSLLLEFQVHLENKWNVSLPQFDENIETVNDLVMDTNRLYNLTLSYNYKTTIDSTNKRHWWKFWLFSL